MDDTRVDIIIHIDEDLSDSILEFKGEFTPLLIASNIKSGIPDAKFLLLLCLHLIRGNFGRRKLIIREGIG
jgi:hypothetical protein